MNKKDMDKKFFFLLFLSCLFCLPTLSQEAKVISLTETIDFIPAADQKRDLNKDLCALVKIQVVDEITEIEGNVIGDIVNHGVEKWVYMAKGSKNMKIHFQNNLPIRVKFQDYKISALQSNRVYELVIKVPTTMMPVKQTANVKGNNLQMRITPNNASVTIWGDDMQRRVYRPLDDGSLSVFLPYGRYYYQASASGYESTEGTVFVNDEKMVNNVNLTAIMGTLTINCLTENADFYLNNERLNKKAKTKSWTGQVVPGTHVVQVARKGYVTQTKTVVVVARESSSVQIDRLMTLAEQQKAVKAEAKVKKKAEAKEKADLLAQAKKQEKEAKAHQKGQKALGNRQIKEKTANKTKQANDKHITFGIRAGLNLATIGLKEEAKADGDAKAKMMTSFHAGINADIRLSKPFHLNVALLFSEKGYEYEYDYYDNIKETTKAQFLMLPVQISYRIGILQINAGSYLDFGIGGKVKYGRNDREYDTFKHYKSLNYGITTGVGVVLSNHFYLGANYEMGMSDYANRNIAISLGYNF